MVTGQLCVLVVVGVTQSHAWGEDAKACVHTHVQMGKSGFDPWTVPSRCPDAATVLRLFCRISAQGRPGEGRTGLPIRFSATSFESVIVSKSQFFKKKKSIRNTI